MRKLKLSCMFLLSLLSISSLSASDINNNDNNSVKKINVSIETKEGYRVYLESKMYNELILKNKLMNIQIENANKNIKKHNCKIKMIEKAVAKLIKDQNCSINDNKSKEILNTFINKTPKEDKIKCINKTVINKDILKGSYFKFHKLKHFTVTRTSGVYEYPILNIHRIKTLKKGDSFNADMYTKAGWVHFKDGWVKGYTLNPPLRNRTTIQDIQKWRGLNIKSTKCN